MMCAIHGSEYLHISMHESVCWLNCNDNGDITRKSPFIVVFELKVIASHGWRHIKES